MATTRATNSTDPCDPATLGLGSAKPLGSWKAPPGCVPRDVSTGNEPTRIANEEEFRAHFTCASDAGNRPSGVDFSKNELAVSLRMLSPAGMGYVAVDDGSKVTNISRQRSSCPNDPRPMPVQIVQAYLLPSHATRAFAEVACTVPQNCP